MHTESSHTRPKNHYTACECLPRNIPSVCNTILNMALQWRQWECQPHCQGRHHVFSDEIRAIENALSRVDPAARLCLDRHATASSELLSGGPQSLPTSWISWNGSLQCVMRCWLLAFWLPCICVRLRYGVTPDRDTGGEEFFWNIFKIHEWLLMIMNDFLPAYSVVCDNIKIHGSLVQQKGTAQEKSIREW
jgi:hypothetical protein